MDDARGGAGTPTLILITAGITGIALAAIGQGMLAAALALPLLQPRRLD